ncbi:MAG: PAS-domain containing protein [Rhodobacteraceae bacterium]|nr:PAS-domain containing protein [Paracoccaceae bacterium]
MFPAPDWILLLATSMACAIAAVFWVSRRPASASQVVPDLSNKVYLFSQEDLIDVSAGAPTLPDCSPDTSDWQRLRQMLMGRFPEFPKTYRNVKLRGRVIISAELDGDSATILGEWVDGITRIELREPAAKIDQNVQALPPSEELETLRMAVDEAPYPVWRVETNGTVSWHNKAYTSVYKKVRRSKPDAAQPLFSPTCEALTKGQERRMSIAIPDSNKAYWFDVSTKQHDDYCLLYATDINAVVDAELAQRNFVQTLAKTFAQLSIGLAIFDRNRQLILFNPALIDLTSLSADFLSGRPNLFSFFDRLRDSRMMPEPKNYNSWRHEMANLVAAAADGRYQETWSLPSGSVYSVNGRPHPDGAVAFLFEDITAEVTLTRMFRSDLQLGQSILDNLNDAIVVFGADGVLTISNAAYRTMWDVNPDSSFANVTILDATQNWQDKCDATPVWGDVRDYIVGRENRVEWWAPVQLKSGESLICTVNPIQSGATMVSFSLANILNETDTKQHEIAETD